jgi:hypothetical protein
MPRNALTLPVLTARTRQHDQVGHLPSLQWQLDDALVFDDLVDAGAAHVYERRRGLNRHGLFEVAHRERGVDRRAFRPPATRCLSVRTS